jgi:hypothetical protein
MPTNVLKRKLQRKTDISVFTQMLRPFWRRHWLPHDEEVLALKRLSEHRAKAQSMGISYPITENQFLNIWRITDRLTRGL